MTGPQTDKKWTFCLKAWNFVNSVIICSISSLSDASFLALLTSMEFLSYVLNLLRLFLMFLSFSYYFYLFSSEFWKSLQSLFFTDFFTVCLFKQFWIKQSDTYLNFNFSHLYFFLASFNKNFKYSSLSCSSFIKSHIF